MLNRWIRYFPILDFLDSSNAEPILEVGSGSLGMGEFIRRTFVGCDLLLDPNALSPTLLPVCATGTDLPFRDGSFRTVLCLDTMEHVPFALREGFVRELLRVTSHVLILGAPMGLRAANADRQLHQYYASRNIQEPLWLAEHMVLIDEFPRADYFENLFGDLGLSVEKRLGESAFVHVFVIILEHMRYVGRAVGMLSRRPWRQLLRPLLHLMNRSAGYRTYFIVRKP